jgi:hypothetical protein
MDWLQVFYSRIEVTFSSFGFSAIKITINWLQKRRAFFVIQDLRLSAFRIVSINAPITDTSLLHYRKK